MKDMYGGFERWLNKYGRNIIVAKKSIKSLHSVISTWVHEKTNKQLEHRLSENEGEHDSDNVEEDGYCSDKGTNRLSISWSKEERDRVDGVEEEVSVNHPAIQLDTYLYPSTQTFLTCYYDPLFALPLVIAITLAMSLSP